VGVNYPTPFIPKRGQTYHKGDRAYGEPGHISQTQAKQWAEYWRAPTIDELLSLPSAERLARVRALAQEQKLIAPDATTTEVLAVSPQFNKAVPFEVRLQDLALATLPEMLEFMHFFDPTTLPDAVFQPKLSPAGEQEVLNMLAKVKIALRGLPDQVDIPDELSAQVRKLASLHNHPDRPNVAESFSPDDLVGAIARGEIALMMIEGSAYWQRLNIFVPRGYNDVHSRSAAMTDIAGQYNTIYTETRGGPQFARISDPFTLHYEAIKYIAQQYGILHEIVIPKG
jgi:hypothetical protein